MRGKFIQRCSGTIQLFFSKIYIKFEFWEWEGGGVMTNNFVKIKGCKLMREAPKNFKGIPIFIFVFGEGVNITIFYSLAQKAWVPIEELTLFFHH